FGLTAVNLFGVTCNIVSWACHLHKRNSASSGSSRTRRWPAFLRRGQTATVAQSNDAHSSPPDTVLPPLAGAIPYGFLTMSMGEGKVYAFLVAVGVFHSPWEQPRWFSAASSP